MFDDDRHLQGLITNIRDSLTAAFNAASQYCDTFEPYREFYKENESCDLEAIRNKEHGMICGIIVPAILQHSVVQILSLRWRYVCIYLSICTDIDLMALFRVCVRLGH